MSSEVQRRVRQVVSQQLGVEVADLREEASILDDLGADSLDVVELVMALEEEFDVEVPDADVESMRTLGDIERYVAKRAVG
jgi:acyl carrier protein